MGRLQNLAIEATSQDTVLTLKKIQNKLIWLLHPCYLLSSIPRADNGAFSLFQQRYVRMEPCLVMSDWRRV